MTKIKGKKNKFFFPKRCKSTSSGKHMIRNHEISYQPSGTIGGEKTVCKKCIACGLTDDKVTAIWDTWSGSWATPFNEDYLNKIDKLK